MPRPMSTYSPSVAGRGAAAHDHSAGLPPMWVHCPDEWARHSDAFRRAYKQQWVHKEEVASNG